MENNEIIYEPLIDDSIPSWKRLENAVRLWVTDRKIKELLEFIEQNRQLPQQ